MTRDRYRLLTAAAVLIVAAIAAVVSYDHIARLALGYGQPPLAAYLLPLSIDGMVATSSLVLLRAARVGMSAPWLARAGLVLAVLATLAANVASGLPHGWPGALVAGWPAVAFVVSAETVISMSRRSPAGRAGGQPPATTAVTAVAASSGHHAAPAGQRPPGQVATRPPAGRTAAPALARAAGEARGQAITRPSPADTEAAALAALAADPAMTHRQLAEAIGVSERTARRVRARLATPARAGT
jgi:hypothetical protein